MKLSDIFSSFFSYHYGDLNVCSSSTAQYDEDNNSVRMYMRGRPVTFYVPEKLPDGLNYDISKIQPAPAKKLKLDWVRQLMKFHLR